MRKITEESVDAFMNARRFKKSNMEVEVRPNVTILKLFGNEIAYRYNDAEGTLSITNCGWFSNTTKERLNGIPGVRIHQKDFEWYLNDELWDGSLIDITGKAPTSGRNEFDFMKVFMVLGDMTSPDDVKYKERIVFATMRSMIPDWQPPSGWDSLPDKEKLNRLNRIQNEIA